MLVRRLAAVVGVGALFLLVTGPALAVTPTGTLDQKHECAATDCNTIASPFVPGGDALYPAWYSQNGESALTVNLAQTFTAGISGKLTGVQIYANGRDVGGTSGVPTNFTVQIESTTGSDHHPSGTVLATTTVPYPATTTVDWMDANFASQPTVAAGTVYAITLADLDWQIPDDAWLRWELDSATVGDYTNYAGGDAWAATGSTWASLYTVLNDGDTGNADFGFRTYVQAAAGAPSATATQPATTTLASPSQGNDGPLLVMLAAGALLSLAFFRLGAPRRTDRR
ncbi:MAG TPA: hypothetical protein VEI48_04205 [Candidatus Sulfotelmatobacter sp.]|nr:hypothetical protein [Candidatus Sulfotelmatobacter sp.]